MTLVQQMRKNIQDLGWDGLWIASPTNLRYLTGFTGSAGWLFIPTAPPAWLITDGRYAEQAVQESLAVRIKICTQGPGKSLSELLHKYKVEKLGFEEEQVVVQDWQSLKKSLKSLKLIPASGLVEKYRAIKQPWELALLRKAIHIAEKAYTRILPQIKPGVQEIELAKSLENALLDAGGEGLAFPTIVASGPRSSLPHAKPSTRRLKPGDLVILDLGCQYRGYHSDLTRTIAIARMTSRQRELYKIVKNAQKSAKNVLISGQLAADSDKKCREVLKRAKVEKYFPHSLGHGIGLEVHERPKLSSLSKERLAGNMVVTCEPGIYFPGWGGIRIEDDILVGNSSAKWLSQSPEELPVVGKQVS